jgi:hypothetical protein
MRSFVSGPPRTDVLGILSRPYGTGFGGNLNPGLRPGLLSAVPPGLVAIHTGGSFAFMSAVRVRQIEKI